MATRFAGLRRQEWWISARARCDRCRCAARYFSRRLNNRQHSGHAFRWTATAGMSDLGVLSGGSVSDVNRVSADGSVVVGTCGNSSTYRAFRWTAATGMAALGALPGANGSNALDVSADGSVVVGTCDTNGANNRAYRWTAATGMVDLGLLPGDTDSVGDGVSADGSVVVGGSSTNMNVYHAFRWTAAGGMRDLTDDLVNVYGLGSQLAGWSLPAADQCSLDARVMVGTGVDAAGNNEAWIANLDTPPQVAAVQVNDGTAQRSEVRSITVTFSGPVTFAGGDPNAAFQLTHVQTGGDCPPLGVRGHRPPGADGRHAHLFRLGDRPAVGPEWRQSLARRRAVSTHHFQRCRDRRKRPCAGRGRRRHSRWRFREPLRHVAGDAGPVESVPAIRGHQRRRLREWRRPDRVPADDWNRGRRSEFRRRVGCEQRRVHQRAGPDPIPHPIGSRVFPTGPIVAPPPPTIAAVAVNDGAAQRSEVRSITVTFSGPVDFSGGSANAVAAFRLKHLSDDNDVALAATVGTDSDGRTVVRLTFSGAETDPLNGENGGKPSLADGRYQLTIFGASITGADGRALDGDADGSAGGDYVSPADTRRRRPRPTAPVPIVWRRQRRRGRRPDRPRPGPQGDQRECHGSVLPVVPGRRQQRDGGRPGPGPVPGPVQRQRLLTGAAPAVVTVGGRRCSNESQFELEDVMRLIRHLLSRRGQPRRPAPRHPVRLCCQRLEVRTVPASFQGLGHLPGFTNSDGGDISADGSTVVGESRDFNTGGSRAYRWTAATGMVDLGTLPGGTVSYASAVSADGSVVVGRGNTSGATGAHAYRWTAATGMVDLGTLPGASGYMGASGVSADGSVVVGGVNTSAGERAFRWTQATGMVDLGTPFGTGDYDVAGISANGSVIVGSFYPQSGGGSRAFRWTQDTGMVDIGALPGNPYCSAGTVSADGSVVVGISYSGYTYDTYHGVPVDCSHGDGWHRHLARRVRLQSLCRDDRRLDHHGDLLHREYQSGL